MKFPKSALTAGLFLQQAAATGWGNAKSFSNPSNTNNVCTPEQQGGFNWGSLGTGSFNSFGGFQFSGFDCKNSFQPKEKRSMQARSNFQNKCIQGTVSKNAGASPKISGNDFSISQMQVSTSFDTDLDFIFSMPDGSTCKHTAACSAGGSVVQNEQCGGATSVTFQMPQGGSDKGCDIGIHSIGFDCQSASTPGTLVSTSTSSSSSSSSTVVTTTSSPVTTAQTTPQTTPQTTSQTIPATTPQTTPATTPTTSSSSSIYTSPATSIESKSESSSIPVTTAITELVTTEVVLTTLTTCDVTTTATSGNLTLTKTTQTISTTQITSTVTFCPKCGETPPTTIATPTGGSSNTSPPPPPTSAAPPPPPPTSQAPPPPPASSVPTAVLPTTPAPPPATTDITTEIVITTLTTCPVTLTTTQGSSTVTSVQTTVSTIFSTITSTVCTRCTAAPPSTLTSAVQPPPSSAAPPTSSSSVPQVPPTQNNPQLPCPELLPRCLNTWLPQGCSSNSDTKCFCPSSDFASKVVGCMRAYAASDSELQSAASYFAGVCADFVSSNPGICTNLPSTITLAPAPVPTAQGNAPPAMPQTTVQVVNTVTITKDSQPQTSVTTQVITVPQVQFITQAPAPAPSTAAAGSFAPAPTPTVALVAAPTGTASASVISIAASTYAFGSGYAGPSASATFTGPSTFTGDAAKMNVGFGVVAGFLCVVAFFT